MRISPRCTGSSGPTRKRSSATERPVMRPTVRPGGGGAGTLNAPFERRHVLKGCGTRQKESQKEEEVGASETSRPARTAKASWDFLDALWMRGCASRCILVHPGTPSRPHRAHGTPAEEGEPARPLAIFR